MYDAAHVGPQSMPDGEETVPDPLPAFTIVKVGRRVGRWVEPGANCITSGALNVAPIVVFAFRVTLHVVPVPEQPPDQPEKTLPKKVVAVRVTVEPQL
jgi:hypothetical protein